MASAQQPVTLPTRPGVRTQLSQLTNLLANAVYYVVMIALGLIWITIWSVMAYTNIQLEGLLPGLILGAYAVVPVLVLGYRAARRRIA